MHLNRKNKKGSILGFVSRIIWFALGIAIGIVVAGVFIFVK